MEISLSWLRPSKVLPLILLTAFLGRCAAGLILRPPGQWGSFYLDAARNIAAGRGHVMDSQDSFETQARAFRPPLYPAFLGSYIRVFGENRGLIVLHAALGTLIVWLVYLIGREADSEATGLLAAAAASIYPYYVFNDTSFWDRMPFTLALAWAVLSALKARSVQTGAALGLACLIRPTGLFLVPAVAAWLWRFAPRPRKTVAVAGAAFILTMAPWLARNGAVYGKPVYVSSVGWELWDAHVAMAQDCGYPWVTIDRCIGLATAAIAPAEFARLKGLGELERDREMAARALRFVRAHPEAELSNAWKKLQGIYSPRFNPQLDAELGPIHGRSARWSHSLFYALILAGAGAGFLTLRGRLKLAWLAVYLFAGLTVCTVIFVGHTVHRAPFDFLLMVLASAYAVPFLGNGRDGPSQ